MSLVNVKARFNLTECNYSVEKIGCNVSRWIQAVRTGRKISGLQSP